MSTRKATERATARTKGTSGAPRGRDAVKQALIDAAAELFAERGVNSVGVRDVAVRARVNHGLVHRHFESKDGLVRAVMDGLSDGLTEQLDAATRGASSPDPLLQLMTLLFDAVSARPLYFKVLAQALLDGKSPTDLQSDFPVVKRLVQHARRAQSAGLIPKAADARMIVATAVATGLGWLLFEPYLLDATGQSNLDTTRARTRLRKTWLALLQPRGSSY